MKKIRFLALLAIPLFFISFSSSKPSQRGEWEPIFMKRADLEQSVKYTQESRALKKPGKIYCKGNYIYVSELYKGVHVINNTNPSQPVQEGFIIVPGCVDMAVKGDILYVDNAVDLVAFDLASRQVTQRIRNVLPEPAAPANTYYHRDYNRPKDMILIGWQEK